MKNLFELIDKLLVFISIALFIVLISLMSTQILLRYVFHSPIRGVIIYSNLIFTWLAYLGCAFVARDNCHLRVEYFIDKFPNKIVSILNAIYKFLPLGFLIILIKPIIKFHEFQKGITVAGVGFPVLYFTYAFIVGFSLIAIYTIINSGSDIENIFTEEKA